MRIKVILSVICVLLISLVSYAQEVEYMTGLLPDDGTYDKLPMKKELLTRDYKILPSSYSLAKYCPIVKSQGGYGTCVGWSSAYACRTIAEAIKYGWTDKEKITSEAFSPLFVYAQVKGDIPNNSDPNCQKGSYVHLALQLMKDKGVPKLYSFNVMCAEYVNDDLMQKAKAYKIDDYFTLFRSDCSDYNEKIKKVKKAISEDCPVIISMEIPKSFHMTKMIWSGQDVDPTKHGRHAMCVIGYDDNIQGGAFCIMNSWGPYWGDNGFTWIKYYDFAKYVYQAYEIFVRKLPKPQPKLKPQPQPQPKPQPKIIIKEDSIKKNSLSGKVELQLSTGEKMEATHLIGEMMGKYRLKDSYISGTRYRMYISNNEPAYVYIIGSDMTGNITKVFPSEERISAALTYKSNHIAIPDERYYIELDNTKGTDYMCILYSANTLDINSIIGKMQACNGSFYDKLKVLKYRFVQDEDVEYGQEVIQFKALSRWTIVPVVIEIPHK